MPSPLNHTQEPFATRPKGMKCEPFLEMLVSSGAEQEGGIVRAGGGECLEVTSRNKSSHSDDVKALSIGSRGR
jgi:hypothetical protein